MVHPAAGRAIACVVILIASCAPPPPDPAPGFAWVATGDREDTLFGWAVASAGDVDGDGHEDLLVGARFQNGTHAHEGMARIHRGSTAGPETEPSWSFTGGRKGALLGSSVAGAGDVNGDGFDDVILGAPGWDEPDRDAGAAFLFLGSAEGLADRPAARLGIGQPHARFGESVAGAGDVDGDGFADVIVGAPRFDGDAVDEGAVFLFRGSPDGIDPEPAWTMTGGQPGAALGRGLAGAGDVNGDGYADVIVGAPGWERGEVDEGVVMLFAGSATGLAKDPVWRFEPDAGGALLGAAVASGDVNGDGFADLIIGAPAFYRGQAGEGRAFLFTGSPTGPSVTPVWSSEGDEIDAQFGAAVAVADLEGDGFADVIVGAPACDAAGGGCVFVFGGSAGGVSVSPVGRWTAGRTGARFGQCVAGLGRENGGADLLIGAPRFDDGLGHQGRVFLHRAAAGEGS